MVEAPSTERSGDSEQVGEVLRLTRQMQDTLESLDTRVRHLERQDEGSGPKFDLQNVVFKFLPEQPDDVRTPADRWDDGEHSGEPDHRIHRWAATAEEMARKIGAEPDDVEEALTDLAQSTGQVIQANPEGIDRTLYWKK